MDEPQRIGRIEPICIDGEKFYKLDAVCTALRVKKESASRLIPKEHKRRYRQFRGAYNSYRYAVIDRSAVETLVIKYGKSSRSETMNSLK